jgi:hypothetical protein
MHSHSSVLSNNSLRTIPVGRNTLNAEENHIIIMEWAVRGQWAVLFRIEFCYERKHAIMCCSLLARAKIIEINENISTVIE